MNALTPTTPPQPTAATTNDWARFLRPLLASVRQPPSAEDFKIRVTAIAFALPHVPADLLTEKRQREMVAKFAWWPAAADIAEWLRPALIERREHANLMALPAPEPAEPRGPRTVEELLAVREKVQAFMAERNKAPGSADMPPVQPRYLTDTQLIAALERDIAVGGPGVEACKMRLKALKAKLGAQMQEARA